MKAQKIALATRDPGWLCLSLGAGAAIGFLILRIEILALISSMLLACVFASRIFAKSCLKGLRVSVSSNCLRARADGKASVQLQLVNENRLLPVIYPLVDLQEEGQRHLQSARYQGIVLPGKGVSLPTGIAMHARGIHPIRTISAYSHFPFGFQEARVEAKSQTEPVIVWPSQAQFNLDAIFRERRSLTSYNNGDRRKASETFDALRIREYAPGDSRRLVNWKLSAKLDTLIVVEPRQTPEELYDLHLDTAEFLWSSPIRFERMLSMVATLVPEMLRRRCLRSITINQDYYPLASQAQFVRFSDALSAVQTTKKIQTESLSSSKNTLWIMPHRKLGITLASKPQVEKASAR